MFYVTVAWTWARALVNAMLTALLTRPGAALTVTTKVRIWKGTIVPSPDDTVGLYTAVAFTGYADQAVTLGPVVNIGNNKQAVVGHADFQMVVGTLTPTGDVGNGYMLYDGGTAFYGAERFSAPINWIRDGDNLSLDMALPVADSATNP